MPLADTQLRQIDARQLPLSVDEHSERRRVGISVEVAMKAARATTGMKSSEGECGAMACVCRQQRACGQLEPNRRCLTSIRTTPGRGARATRRRRQSPSGSLLQPCPSVVRPASTRRLIRRQRPCIERIRACSNSSLCAIRPLVTVPISANHLHTERD